LEGQELTQKKSYSRFFIILQEDERGYALASDKLPSGYAKLEIKNDKCKISYYVQNLKKESEPYFMILICNKKDVKKIVKLGELNIDDHGRAEVSYEYPVENMGNCGVNVDKVIGAGIVKFMNSNMLPVMSGFASNEIPEWRSFVVIEEEKKRIDTKPAKVEQKVEPVVESKPEPVIEVEPQPAVQPANIFEEYENKIEEVKIQEEIKPNNPIDAVPNMPVEEDIMEEAPNMPVEEDIMEEAPQTKEMEDNYGWYFEDESRKKKDKKDSCKEKEEEEKGCKHDEHHKNDCKHDEHHKDDYKHKGEYKKGSIGAYFEDLADGFEELQGFCSEIKRCKWFKVPVKRSEDMTHCTDYNKYTVVYYPMMNYFQYIKKHSHFLMGYKCDKENKMKYLVYAIPGTKSKLDQPFGGRSGFVTWVPLRDGEEDDNSFGYWLMFYDFKNSTIVIPVK
jgi:hypothetical protein